MRSVRDCGLQFLHHSSYSRNLVPSDYYRFFKIEKGLQGQIYDNDNELTYGLGEFFRERVFYREGIDAPRWTK